MFFCARGLVLPGSLILQKRGEVVIFLQSVRRSLDRGFSVCRVVQ